MGGIKELRSSAVSRRRFVQDSSLGGHDEGTTQRKARDFAGGNARQLEQRCQNGDMAFKTYIDKFAYFFRRDFLVQRMFEVMNSEGKPEHVGFAKACDQLWPVYKHRLVARGLQCEQQSLLEYLYDDMLIELDVEKASDFFVWLGVLDAPLSKSAPQASPERTAKESTADWQDEEAILVNALKASEPEQHSPSRQLDDMDEDLAAALRASQQSAAHEAQLQA